MIVHSHISGAGSLEGFVLVNGRSVAWSLSLGLARRDPLLVTAIVECAKTIAKETT